MADRPTTGGPEDRGRPELEGLGVVPAPEAETARPTGPQMLLLRLAGAEFALPVDCVCGVIEVPPVTKVPLAPSSVAGVAAVRGDIVPVIDLGMRLRNRPTVGAPRLVTVETPSVAGRIGLLADDVVGMIQVSSAEAIEPLPADAAADFPEGVASGVFSPAEGRVIVVLRLDGLLAIDELVKES
ncbi:MAG TPA: chemotaxis protein CheW [Longimicrobiales bacterium]|nr:chemotaxis protein CheW [Longimicrobiales bacterium]